MQTHVFRIGFFIVVMLALSSAVHQPGVSASSQVEDDAVVLLEQATRTMLDLESFHFNLTTPVGKTFLVSDVELVSIEGDVVRPLSFQAKFSVKLAFITLPLEARGIDTTIWVQEPLTGTFVKVGGEIEESLPPLDFLNPDWLLQRALSMIEKPVVAGIEELNGATVTRIDGSLDMSFTASMATPLPSGILNTEGVLPISLWIDAQSRLVRAEFAGPLLASEADAGQIVRRIDLSAFNEPVEITPPEETV